VIGKLFNQRYLIQEKLGSGGTAIVFKGQDTLLNRMVTVKILREEYASNEDFVRRFRREAQAVASLSHGNIVAVYDVGFEENMHYIVMEFVEGQSLKECIKERGALPVQEAASVMIQILEGISYAHEHGIIHRDIKPHNILLGKDGRAKVTDFGIAVGMTDMTQTYNTSSRIMGSVHYIAPEQVQGQAVTEKSDIYSAGVVFYEMLTGQLPFTGDTPISIAMQHVQGELILPHQMNTRVPMGLSYVVMRAMRKNPETRYDNVREMIEATRSVTEGLNSVYVPPPEEGAENARPLSALAPVKDSEPARPATARRPAIFNKRAKEERAPREQPPPPDFRRERNAPRRRVSVMSIILVLLLLAFAATMVWAVGKLYEIFNSGPDTVTTTTVTVPSVVGMDSAEAVALLMELELNPSLSRKNDEIILIDKVMYQSLPASSEAARGKEIVLTVSDGPRLTEVPGVIGDSEILADRKLQNKGLIPAYLEPEYNEDFPAGDIFRQDPAPGAQVKGGTEVELTVSLGPEPEPVTVPNVVEKTFDEAKKLLEEAGLVVGKIKPEDSNTYNADIVIGQSARAGSELNAGDSVDLTVSRGPGPVTQTKFAPLRYVVPDDGMSHRITIVVDDQQGPPHKWYEQVRSPGDAIAEQVPYLAPATIYLYCDDDLAWKDIFE
jgi:serine/threonine-protein kinase